MYDIISKKKEGKPLSKSEIEFFVKGITDGSIPDYQGAALLMAICLCGMDEEETVYLTTAMAESGEMVDLSSVPGITADKHSTGGVGDKVSLVLVPLVAACGLYSVKMSGRGLGHTGGTVDKLESIPGIRTDFTPEEMIEISSRTGGIIAAQSARLTPADKKLYALRDVTATVNSIPLIASSIMSKKLAGGNESILLDVKFGSGAFMKTPEEAEKLARLMVRIGEKSGRKMKAVLSDMNEPLGYAVGNALEVKEAISVLLGEEGSLREEVLTAATLMLESAGIRDAKEKCEKALSDGSAFQKFKEIIKAQGGDISYIEHPEKLPEGKFTQDFIANKDGYIFKMNCEEMGRCAQMLGAGRETLDEEIDPGAGFVLHKKCGDKVMVGDAIATLYVSRKELFVPVLSRMSDAVEIRAEEPPKKNLVYKIIE